MNADKMNADKMNADKMTSERGDLPVILLIDDEPNVLYSLRKGLRDEAAQLVTASSAREACEAFAEWQPDVVLCDIQLPDGSGLDLFREFHAADRKVPVIIMTAHGSAETAIEAMKRGAFDYLLKPYDLVELRQLLQRAISASRMARIPVMLETEPATEERVDRIIGRSAAMQNVYKEIGRVAERNVNVLLLGESGSGKELVARAIYRHGKRNASPFLALNCAALPETILESELFGHEQGAFTGANRRRIGKFEQADGGTLFLDEIGDMALSTQAKVLRVLEDGVFDRIGGRQPIHADVRIIAATNRDLEGMIAEQTFREDLFYRLNTFTIRLPALRERIDDLPDLVDYFLRNFSKELGKPVGAMAADLLPELEHRDWPGNVRELANAIRYAILHCSVGAVAAEHLPVPAKTSETADKADELGRLIERTLQLQPGNARASLHAILDGKLAAQALKHTQGNHTAAAQLMGISRTTLRAILNSGVETIPSEDKG